MSDDWVKVMNGETSAAELEMIIERAIAHALEEFRETLAANPDLTDADRATALARVAPFVEQQTRDTLVSAHRRLQH